MSAEEQLAWLYQGQQEGHEHRSLKHFIADWVEREPTCSSPAWRDKVRVSELKTGEWKRPDVRAILGAREVVFEIQLSYTFLSEVLRRDAFYRHEHVHILWIFRSFEPHREVVRDEFFHNRRNIFVLDADAERETIKRGRLTLRCHYQTPSITGDTISEKWSSRYVCLDELNYPQPEFRPYYRDFEEARLRLLRLALVRAVRRWGRARKGGGESIASAYSQAQTAWRALEHATPTSRPEFFSDGAFLTEHLPRLLSIKYGRPIGYRYRTVWEVLNAALCMSDQTERPNNILYLMAVKHYQPSLSPEHAKRIEDHKEEIMRSIKAGESRFLRDQSYDTAVAAVLPELLPLLKHPYGSRIEHGNSRP